MISIKRGFTLIELLVVISMIAVIIAAVSTSVSSAQQRARVQRATSDVKVVSQAILSYENWMRTKGEELPSLTDAEADSGNLSFLLGKGGNDAQGNKIPAVLMASLQSGGKMRDPWGTPYRVTIRRTPIPSLGSTSLSTGYCLPNQHRVTKDERMLIIEE